MNKHGHRTHDDVDATDKVELFTEKTDMANVTEKSVLDSK